MKLLKKLRPDPLLYEICAELGMFVMLPIITSLLWVLITPLLILGARGIGLIQNDHGIHSFIWFSGRSRRRSPWRSVLPCGIFCPAGERCWPPWEPWYSLRSCS